LLFVELGFIINILSMTWDTVPYTGRSGRALLHHSVEDEM
jgi:hypothetical protein